MTLQTKDIYRIAKLSRLALDPNQAQALGKQLDKFFAVVEKMQAVDTDGVEPLAHPSAIAQEVCLRLQEDTVSEDNQREAIQQSAPAVAQGLYLVPRVIE